LVTGGNGFIGAALVKRLRRAGYKVSIFDLPKHDICKYDQVDKAVKKVDIVYHLAAVADLNYAREHPQETFDVNITGTNNVALACAKHDVLLNFTSTCCIYGNQKKHPSNEKSLPNPTEIYACSKMAGEYIVLGLAKLFGLRYNIMRIATTYGPGMRPALAVYIFLDKALKNKPIQIHGSGRQTRTFTYIDDEVEGMARFVESGVQNRIINITTEEEISILACAEKSLELCGKNKNKINFTEDRPGQIFKEHITARRARRLLNWEAKISMDEGLKRTLKWMKKNQDLH